MAGLANFYLHVDLLSDEISNDSPLKLIIDLVPTYVQSNCKKPHVSNLR